MDQRGSPAERRTQMFLHARGGSVPEDSFAKAYDTVRLKGGGRSPVAGKVSRGFAPSGNVVVSDQDRDPRSI